MKLAELRRSYEELVDANRLLEDANRLLEAECSRLRAEIEKLKEPAVSVPKKQHRVVQGRLVDYVDRSGRVHVAIVVAVVDDSTLELKVFRTAAPDKIVTVTRQVSDKQTDCWRTRW